MADQFTLDDLKQILTDRVGLKESDVADLGEDATFEQIGLDSLAFLEIQLEVEQRYGFQVADEDAQKILSFSDAVDYVNGQLKEMG